MARPKNKIPTGLLAARVPLELIETVRREADAAGMRLGEFLAQAMEAACNERMWARARELLAQAQADLETADSDEARAILEGRIELCKEILGLHDDVEEGSNKDVNEEQQEEQEENEYDAQVRRALELVNDAVWSLYVTFRDDGQPEVGRNFVLVEVMGQVLKSLKGMAEAVQEDPDLYQALRLMYGVDRPGRTRTSP